MTNLKPYLSYETDFSEEVVWKLGDTYVVAGWDKQEDPSVSNPGVVFMTKTENLDKNGQWDWTAEDLNRNPNCWFYDDPNAWETKTTALLEQLK
jgi:hypothetical protein